MNNPASDTCLYFLNEGAVPLDDPRFLDYAAMVLDQWVEQWHCGWSSYTQLHDYLGMTKYEYDKWVADPTYLKVLLRVE